MQGVHSIVRSDPKLLIYRVFPRGCENRSTSRGDRRTERSRIRATLPRNQLEETTMHKTSKYRARALLTSVAAATLLFVATSAGARAENAHINEMIFDVKSPYQAAIIQVSSSNGAKWDTIQPGNIGFWAHMKADTRWPGYVKQAGVFLGKCTNTECANNPLLFSDDSEVRDYDRTGNISFSTDKLKIVGPGIFAMPYGEDILRRCNLELQSDGATKPHSFYLGIDASFSVNTREKLGSMVPGEVHDEGYMPPFNGGDATRHGAFLAEVKCLATSKTTANANPDPHRTKVTATNIELFLATLMQPASAGRGPSGTQCKPIKVTTRIETDKAGPKNVKLWRQVNGGPITSESKQMHATVQGGGKFGDDWVKWENFTKTTTVQYMAEVLGGTFAPSTPWKSIAVHCNGNFASPTSDANPDNGKPKPQPPTIVTPPPRVTCVGGKVAGGTCGCPRTHTAVKNSSAAFQCVKTAATPDRPAASPRQPHAAPAYLVGPNRPGGMRPGAPFARGRLSAMPPRLYFR
jgi:hypothetical protein